MRAVIQAGGKGTRLCNLTKDEIPKPMVPVLGKPLLQWQVEQLRKNGIKEIFIIVGHLGNVIKTYFKGGDEFGVSITYLEESEPLGSAGALFYLKGYLQDKEDLFFIYGDVFFDVDLRRMAGFHQRKHSKITAFVHPNTHPYDSDIIQSGRDGRVVGLLKKNEERRGWHENLVNAAFYMIHSDVVCRLNKLEKLDFETHILLDEISRSGCVFGYRSTEYVKDAGTEARLHQLEEDMKSGLVEKRNLSKKQKCMFLDRDGTINYQNGWIDCESKFEMMEEAAHAIRMINSSEYLAIVVTNQPVVARGMCRIEDVRDIHKKMETLLGERGIYLDDIAFCPHHPDKGFAEENPEYKIRCNCRKPGTGMLEQMAEKYHISLEDSWMIGDSTVDIMTGKNAGMHTALVLTGEAGKDHKYDVKADMEGENLEQVVQKLLT